MGYLRLDCMANNGREVYGITLNTYSRHVLVKSNMEPKDLAFVSWTLVSAIPGDREPRTRSMPLCSVNEKGAFTVVQRTWSDSTGLSTPNYRIGFQYNPAFPPNESVDSVGPGGGGWKNLTGPANMWEIKSDTALGNLQNPAGENDVVFVQYLSNNGLLSRPSTFQFFKLDVSTGTFREGPQWGYDFNGLLSMRGVFEDIFFAGNTLNTLQLVGATGSDSSMMSISFQNGTIPTELPIATGVRVFDTTRATAGCSFARGYGFNEYSGVYDRTYFRVCHGHKIDDPHSLASIPLDTTNASTLNPPQILPQKVPNFFHAWTGFPSRNGAAPVLLLSIETWMWALDLGGPQAGQMQKKRDVLIPQDEFGVPLTAQEKVRNATGLSIEEWVGIAAGDLLGLALLAICVCMRARRVAGKKKELEMVDGKVEVEEEEEIKEGGMSTVGCRG